MAKAFSFLPEPDLLKQAALIDYEWGDQKFEIICTACSLRTLPWEETGEELAWLHCKAMRTAELNPDGPTGMMNVLIPAHYVTRIRPGPTFRLKRSGKPRDIGIFPPNQPTPSNHLSLAAIDEAIAELLRPDRN